jgi:hypothetical protein
VLSRPAAVPLREGLRLGRTGYRGDIADFGTVFPHLRPRDQSQRVVIRAAHAGGHSKCAVRRNSALPAPSEVIPTRAAVAIAAPTRAQ